MRDLVKRAWLLALLLSLTVSGTARAQLSPYAATVSWLRLYQQADGGFSNGLTSGSDLMVTAIIVRAVAATGQDVSAWRAAEGATPLEYLRAQLEAGAGREVSTLVHIIPALKALGADPRSFAGRDLVAELLAQQQPLTFQMGASLLDHALAVQALQVAGEAVPPEAIILLLSRQNGAGGWSATGDLAPEAADVHTTVQALRALAHAGEMSAVKAGLDYLHSVQNPDGGFPWRPGQGTLEGETETHATAFVLLLLAELQAPLEEWRQGETDDPLQALQKLYHAPAFYWRASVPVPNVLATAYALQALVAWGEIADLSGFGGPGRLLPHTGASDEALLGPGLVLFILGLALYRGTRRQPHRA